MSSAASTLLASATPLTGERRVHHQGVASGRELGALGRVDVLEAGRPQPHRPIRPRRRVRGPVLVQEPMPLQIFRMHERVRAVEQGPDCTPEKHLLLEKDVASQPRIVPVAVADGEVYRLAGEIDETGGRVQPDLDSGMTLSKAIEPAHQPFRPEAGLDADRQGPAHGAPVERFHGARNLVEAVAHARQQRLAGDGELHGSVQPHEEGLTEVGLERAHLLSDRGRGDVKLVRGPAEAHVPTRCLKGPERIEGRKTPIHEIKNFLVEKVVIVCCPSAIQDTYCVYRRVAQAIGRKGPDLRKSIMTTTTSQRIGTSRLLTVFAAARTAAESFEDTPRHRDATSAGARRNPGRRLEAALARGGRAVAGLVRRWRDGAGPPPHGARVAAHGQIPPCRSGHRGGGHRARGGRNARGTPGRRGGEGRRDTLAVRMSCSEDHGRIRPRRSGRRIEPAEVRVRGDVRCMRGRCAGARREKEHSDRPGRPIRFAARARTAPVPGTRLQARAAIDSTSFPFGKRPVAFFE